jgi:hypothetical protein
VGSPILGFGEGLGVGSPFVFIGVGLEVGPQL